eukprot:753806-Hanusia_phi.AAC.1
MVPPAPAIRSDRESTGPPGTQTATPGSRRAGPGRRQLRGGRLDCGGCAAGRATVAAALREASRRAAARPGRVPRDSETAPGPVRSVGAGHAGVPTGPAGNHGMPLSRESVTRAGTRSGRLSPTIR